VRLSDGRCGRAVHSCRQYWVLWTAIQEAREWPLSKLREPPSPRSHASRSHASSWLLFCCSAFIFHYLSNQCLARRAPIIFNNSAPSNHESCPLFGQHTRQASNHWRVLQSTQRHVDGCAASSIAMTGARPSRSCGALGHQCQGLQSIPDDRPPPTETVARAYCEGYFPRNPARKQPLCCDQCM